MTMILARSTGSLLGDLIAYSAIGLIIVLIRFALAIIVGNRNKGSDDRFVESEQEKQQEEMP